MRFKTDFLLYCSIFLIGTPALSISYLLGLSLGANDKLGFIFLLFYILLARIKISFQFLKISFLISLLFAFNFVIVPDRNDIANQSYGYIIASVLLGLLLEVSRKVPLTMKRVMCFYVAVNIIAYIIQLLFPLLLNIDTSSFFIQNTIQASYTFPTVIPGYIRAVGLFNESSQVASLFALMPLLIPTPFVWISSGFLVLTTFSNSGASIYLALLFFLILLPTLSQLKFKIQSYTYPLMAFVSFLIFLFSSQLAVWFVSIFNRFNIVGNSEQAINPRLDVFIYYATKVDAVGHGFFMNQPRFDFYTLYIYGFGFILGSIFVLLVILLHIKYRFKLVDFAVVAIMFTTNASILGALVPLTYCILALHSLSSSNSRFIHD